MKVKDSMRVDESESVSSPIFVSPSKTKMPVGVRPKLQEIVVIFIIVFTSREIPNILYNTCIPIHLCQALYAYPLRTSPGSWPCSRTRAPPVPGSDPWNINFQVKDNIISSVSFVIDIIITGCWFVWLVDSHRLIISHRASGGWSAIIRPSGQMVNALHPCSVLSFIKLELFLVVL